MVKFSKENKYIAGFIIFFSCYPLIVSFINFLINESYGDPFIGFVRYFYMIPLIILIFSKRFNGYLILRLLLWFGVLAALSLPYQFVFGEISWFAETGERAGLIRYSTLLGSLTVFGGVVGPLLILNFYFFEENFYLKYINAMLLLMGSILSLQKSAVASIAISIIILFAYGKIKIKFIAGLIVAFILIFNSLNDEFLNSLIVFVSNVVGSVDSDLKTDDDFLESIIVRVIDRPLESVDFFGLEKFILGVGFYGAAGGMGYPDLPMMHNLLGEMLAMYGIFGIILFLAFVIILFNFFKNNILNGPWSFEVVCFWNSALLFLNSVFSGGLFYQPFAASLFFSALAVILQKNGINNDFQKK
jgi:hypothetical protein